MGGSAAWYVYCIIGILGSFIGSVIANLLKLGKKGIVISLIFDVIGAYILIAILRALHI